MLPVPVPLPPGAAPRGVAWGRRIAAGAAVVLAGLALGAGGYLAFSPGGGGSPPSDRAAPDVPGALNVPATPDLPVAAGSPEVAVAVVTSDLPAIGPAEVRILAPAPSPVRVEVRSEPGGATVRIDGRRVGETPLVREFDAADAAREVEFSVERAGFVTATRTARPADVTEGGLSFTLRRRGWTPPL